MLRTHVQGSGEGKKTPSSNLQAPEKHQPPSSKTPPPSFERSRFFTLNIVADVSRPALNPGPIKSRGQAFATLDLHKTLCALRGIWYLVIGISLELGGWNLELCYFSP
jgi:hypothetical protein